MAQVRWTEQAADDVEGISLFIGRDSANYARIVVMNIFKAAERAAMFPFSGRIIPKLEKMGVRETLVGNYRVVYRPINDGIEILAVWHGAREIDWSRFI